MQDGQKPMVWKIGLALLPGMIYLALHFVVQMNESLWPHSWIATLARAVAAVVVIAAFIRAERQFSVWGLPALGIAIPALILTLEHGLWLFFPDGIYNPPPPFYTIGMSIINGLALLMLGGLLVLTANLARQSGAPAAMGLLTVIGLLSLALFDPTYAVLMYRPDLRLPVAAIEFLIVVPHLIIQPLWVLTASSQRQQMMALILVPGIAYVMCLLIDIFFSLPIREGLSGMSGLDAVQTYAFRTWLMFEGVAWLIQIGIVLLCGWLKRTSSPAALELNAASSLST